MSAVCQGMLSDLKQSTSPFHWCWGGLIGGRVLEMWKSVFQEPCRALSKHICIDSNFSNMLGLYTGFVFSSVETLRSLVSIYTLLDFSSHWSVSTSNLLLPGITIGTELFLHCSSEMSSLLIQWNKNPVKICMMDTLLCLFFWKLEGLKKIHAWDIDWIGFFILFLW